VSAYHPSRTPLRGVPRNDEPTVIDDLGLRVAKATYERSRVKVLLGHGQALADWDDQNPAMREALLAASRAAVEDTIAAMADLGLSNVPHQKLRETA
jgi:hypothetical protein